MVNLNNCLYTMKYFSLYIMKYFFSQCFEILTLRTKPKDDEDENHCKNDDEENNYKSISEYDTVDDINNFVIIDNIIR